MNVHVAGHAVVRAEDPSRQRPVVIDVWYPADADHVEQARDYGLGRGRVAESAPPINASCPAVVLSHGAFGAASNYSWIAEHLARDGTFVIGVSHFGESPTYGVETIEPESVTRPWDRAMDLSFALDHIASSPPYNTRVDLTRLGALGHSSGGATVLQLGGAIFDPALMHTYCASNDARLDRGCDYARGAPLSVDTVASRDYRDPRIKAIIALDPALGPGHRPASLAAVTIPVHIVGAVDNDFLPFEPHAARLRARSLAQCSRDWSTARATSSSSMNVRATDSPTASRSAVTVPESIARRSTPCSPPSSRTSSHAISDLLGCRGLTVVGTVSV